VLEDHADQPRPLASYAGLILLFNGLAGAGLVAGARTGALPDAYRASDLALLSVATFKLSRVAAKDRVTSGLRAPFTRFQRDSGFGEVEEAARGRGLQRAVGELLVCPECLGQWVSAGLVALHAVQPRVARTVAATMTVHAASDALQLAWANAREAAK
jgi:hypothetical protein